MQLIQPVKLPTDSFYKFLTILGLVLTLFSLICIYLQLNNYFSHYINVQIEMTTLNANGSVAQEIIDIAKHKMESDALEIAPYKNVPVKKLSSNDLNKIALAMSDARYNLNMANLAKSIAVQGLSQTVKMNADKAILNVLKYQIYITIALYSIPLIAGLLMLLKGSQWWYQRWQVYQDAILKNEATLSCVKKDV